MAPLAPFAIAATAAAGVVGAIGASQAAKAAKATGIANQQGYERAAQVIDQQQQVVDAQYNNELFKFNRSLKQNQSNTEALYLKSGVDLSGTAEIVLADNARLAQYEMNVMDYNNKLAKKKLDDEAKANSTLQKGEEVYMKSGMLGTITGLTDKVVTIEAADGVKLKFLRSQIGGTTEKIFNAEKTETQPVASK